MTPRTFFLAAASLAISTASPAQTSRLRPNAPRTVVIADDEAPPVVRTGCCNRH